LTKAILEQALAAEMTDHLGYEKHAPAGHHPGNTRIAGQGHRKSTEVVEQITRAYSSHFARRFFASVFSN